MMGKNKPDYADIRQLTKMVEETYRVRGKAVGRVSKRSGWTDSHIDYDALHVKRRVSATVETTSTLMARVKSFCPNVPDVFSCEEEWADINASTFFAYDNMEEEDTLALAAAIWMLDRMKASGKLYEAIQLLPEDDGTLDDVYLPDVWDACHSDEILRGMVYAIQQRNADCAALKKQSRGQNGSKEQHDRFFMDEYTAAGTHRQQVPSRQRFEALMELTPHGAIDQAVERCENKMWEWAERYFKCRAIFAEKENKLKIKTERFFQETEAKIKELKEQRDELRAAVKNRGPVMSPLLMRPTANLFQSMREPFPKDMVDPLRFMERVKAEEERLEDAGEALSDRIADFHLTIQLANTSPQKADLSAFPKEITTIMEGFSVDDPYEICFGMLYLIDRGSDLPWLYFMGLSVLHQARIRLPWHIGEYDEEDDAIWNDVDIYTGEKRPKASVDALPSGITAPEMPDWYSLDYVDRNQDPLFQFHVNLAQVFYELTGAIMPRNLQRYYPALMDLAHYGIKGKKATLPLLYCMALAGEAKRQSHDVRRLFSDAEDYEADAENEVSVAGAEPTPVSTEQLLADFTALKKENKRLNHALHQADREVRESRERNETRAKAAENQRQELADLRALIFNREEGSFEDDGPSDPSITFPYETKRRVLVFGGHDSWTREIKPRLPDVRFIGKDVVPDINLLRNAEIIWIQTNCISHKQYDKIMSVARRRDIPVRYFAYASATKCAEQVVREDSKHPSQC